ncbi:hypothetical protein C943_02725 [Mariniradius saccharolyticus AK6]|uniref:Uncharacterized protein n=1 Tax=Mariniradius saccharolyticus AK6 TaxID=1239962 RepID=M7XQW7_9BACT|nr:hypothetical protein C943_02725 [Mariniradius saccharolyticus AK6]
MTQGDVYLRHVHGDFRLGQEDAMGFLVKRTDWGKVEVLPGFFRFSLFGTRRAKAYDSEDKSKDRFHGKSNLGK